MTGWIILAAAAQVAATPVASAPAPQKMSAQQAFDAATDAYVAGRHEEAVARLSDLQKTVRSPKILAVVRLRKGLSLIELGRKDEGESDIRAALPVLTTSDEALRPEIFEARIEVGSRSLFRLDYIQARMDGEAALAIAADDINRVRARLLLARATMFDPDDTAVTHADAARALAEPMRGLGKEVMGDIYTIHARALLNHGRKAEALSELHKALDKQGGLTLKVDMRDIVTRSDLAIAALLNGRKDSAREYLAYTGAGRGKQPFAFAAALDLPACGGVAGLSPEDVAVVEFSIADDGSVISAAPIYSSRLGPAALEFARTALGWSWRPDDVKDVPLIFRLLTRVEVRCSTAIERPSIVKPIADAFARWVAAHGAKDFDQPAAVGPALAAARAERDRRQPAGGLSLIPPLMAIAANPAAGPEERASALTQATQLLDAVKAPAGIAVYPRLIDILSVRGWTPAQTVERRAQLRGLLAQPLVAEDAQLAATLRLLIAEPAYRAVNPAEAEPLLRQVVDDKRLPDGDPLRTGALLRLATLQAGTGRIEDARASYAASGVSAQQCSLVDARQAIAGRAGGSNDFPLEAMRWGFEGWVRTEYDLGADGRTLNQRAIITYPPFVFRDAAIGIARNIRYTQSYRPAGVAGCNGEQQSIRFLLP